MSSEKMKKHKWALLQAEQTDGEGCACLQGCDMCARETHISSLGEVILMDKVYNTWSLLWIVLTFILNQMVKHKTF